MYRVIVIVLAFMLGVFIFFGADSAKTRGQKKWVKVIGTLLVWILAVLGAGVLVLCCLAAWDYWKTGDPETAVSLGITAVILAAEARFMASIMIRSSMMLLFTGEQVDWTIKQSEPRTDSNRETAISPSLKVPTSDFPKGRPRHSAIRLATIGLELAVKILMSFP